MHYFTLFLVGAFLCNCIPHLAKGVQGEPFPTPFATPRGIGNSSPLINFLWGALNLAIALAGLSRHPISLGANTECLAIALGVLLMGLFLATHFGKVRREAIASA